MIQTVNPNYAAASRTAEIMSKYRPIAPKPEPSDSSRDSSHNNLSDLPRSISKSPYMRTMWAQLQARPTRARKRGRNTPFGPPPTTVKRIRAAATSSSPNHHGMSYPYPYHHHHHQHPKTLAMHGFAAHHTLNNGLSLVPVHCGLDEAVSTLTESISMAPFIRFPGRSQESDCCRSGRLDLNLVAAADYQNPRELDFMPRLNEPVKAKPAVISPKAVRPVGSTITVKTPIEDDPNCKVCAFNASKEVEKEAENEEIPVMLSNSNNKVTLANAKYREMIGQPECCWLDLCVGEASCKSKRIGGEVTLKFRDHDDGLRLKMMKGFTSEVKIEWEIEGKKKCVVGLCKAVKLVYCEGKEYQFLWRFYDTCEVACKDISE